MKVSNYYSYAPKSEIKANKASTEGTYQFYTSSQSEDYRCNEPIYDCSAIIIGTGGNATLHYYDGKFSTSTDCLVLIPNEKIRPKYLYYFFLGNMDVLEASFKGAGLKHTSKERIDRIEIKKLPSLAEQDRIIDLLDVLIDNIEKRKKQIKKLDILLESRFAEQFEKTQSVNVEQVCESFRIGPFGSALHKNEISDTGFSFVLGTDNAVRNEFAYDEKRFISEEKYKELVKYKVNPGDIIMSMMGTVGRASIIPEDIGTAIISSHLCILRVDKKKMLPEFFHLAFCKDDYIQHQINGIHSGSIMKGFNLDNVKAFKIKYPPITEQEIFLDLSNQIKNSKLILQELANKNQLLFSKLMQKYFLTYDFIK